jgi:nicotinate-nucleotide adenylyltransferase
MNIGLFGGTFDPIHRGHMALAQAAQAQYGLKLIYFVPANISPHKQQPVAPYVHRYAMVALATAAEKSFVPSLLEAPGGEASSPEAASEERKRKPQKGNKTPMGGSYSIDTVREFKKTLRKSDKLFFLIGIDAFHDIAKWHEPEALLRECEFIVASRRGYSLADVANALPETLRPAEAVTHPFRKQAAKGDLVLPGVTIHLLEGVHQDVSATAVREAASKGKPLGKFLDAAVAEYIKKVGLYR